MEVTTQHGQESGKLCPEASIWISIFPSTMTWRSSGLKNNNVSSLAGNVALKWQTARVMLNVCATSQRGFSHRFQSCDLCQSRKKRYARGTRSRRHENHKKHPPPSGASEDDLALLSQSQSQRLWKNVN